MVNNYYESSRPDTFIVGTLMSRSTINSVAVSPPLVDFNVPGSAPVGKIAAPSKNTLYVDDGINQSTYIDGEEASVMLSVAWSPDGDYIAVGSEKRDYRRFHS